MADKETMEKQEIADKLIALIEEYGLEDFIFVASKSSYKHGGMSVTRAISNDETPIRYLREELRKWEKHHGYDPDEDWRAK